MNLNAIGDKLALPYGGPTFPAVVPLAKHAARVGTGTGGHHTPRLNP